MKNYLSFSLTGKKLLPVWILFLILFLAPYMFLVFNMNSLQQGKNVFLFLGLLIALVTIAMAITFYIARLSIENLVFREKNVEFKGHFSNYMGVILLGLFLSIITFGIYSPWFIRNVQRFYIDNSSYDSGSFKFKGKGGRLFVILLLTIVAPVILLSVLMFVMVFSNPESASKALIIQQVIMMFVMIPYMYMVYKWMVNIDYKGYNITWETTFWDSCGKIALEMLLIVITLGIFMPLAMVRLYKYFISRTIAAGSDNKISFGYDIDPMNDFLFIWGQTLLTMVTLGVYYPWAYSKIGKRILGKTYLETNQTGVTVE